MLNVPIDNASSVDFIRQPDSLPTASNELALNFLNTNARSLRPKITSLIDAFNNLDLTFAIITETWFTDGSKLQSESENLLLGHGLGNLTKNRPPGNAGFSHGGVAIIFRDAEINASEIPFQNPERFEVLPVQLTVKGVKQKVIVIGVYMPPGYTVARSKACIQHIKDLILTIKNKLNAPYICLAGDTNQWPIEQALDDYPDMVESSGGPTRGNRTIDRCFTNWPDDIKSTTVLPPVETEVLENTVRRSDHSIVYLESKVPRIAPPNWQTFSVRPYSKEKAARFKEWISRVDWGPVFVASGSNAKTRHFQQILQTGLDECFPTKIIRRKETDLPWFNHIARKKVGKKKAVYKSEGRSPRWWAVANDLERYLEKRQENYLENQRGKFLKPNRVKNFFRNVKSFNSAEKPKTFDVRSLHPGSGDEEVAEEVATFFNKISDEFKPLDPFDIPRTYEGDLPRLSSLEVEKTLRTFKKPASMVEGDIFPSLVGSCSEQLSAPLADIFNTVTASSVWPIAWKKETVTVIPKKKIPQLFADLRNISCTPLFSKLYEGYVLTWALEEITLKNNQFGGVKGCSTAHMVVSIINEMCENCEDYWSGTVLTAIDYAKAFNRVSYQHCLMAFKEKGASSAIIRLLATFLTNQTMSVKIGNVRSVPKPVNGGCPQGSKLGVLLFNTTTDSLENDFLGLAPEAIRTDTPESPPPLASPPPRTNITSS